MLIVHVFVHVKDDCITQFADASRENAQNSIHEPGVARFDVVQSVEDPTRFVLIEVYRTSEAAAAHKQTAHYAVWRDTVADMMVEPRSAATYAPVFPGEALWG